jgi:hypothetical protein
MISPPMPCSPAALSVITPREVETIVTTPDVVGLTQNANNLALDLRRRDSQLLVAGMGGVPDPGQQIRNRVCHRHQILSTKCNRLPARLNDTRNFTVESQVSETEAAETKSPQVSTGTAADAASVVRTYGEFRFTLLLFDQTFLRHQNPPSAITIASLLRPG